MTDRLTREIGQMLRLERERALLTQTQLVLPEPMVITVGGRDVRLRPLVDILEDDPEVARRVRRWRAQARTSSASTIVYA